MLILLTTAPLSLYIKGCSHHFSPIFFFLPSLSIWTSSSFLPFGRLHFSDSIRTFSLGERENESDRFLYGPSLLNGVFNNGRSEADVQGPTRSGTHRSTCQKRPSTLTTSVPVSIPSSSSFCQAAGSPMMMMTHSASVVGRYGRKMSQKVKKDVAV